jgi:hypothetical protein
MNDWVWSIGGMIVAGKPKYSGLWKERPVTDHMAWPPNDTVLVVRPSEHFLQPSSKYVYGFT